MVTTTKTRDFMDLWMSVPGSQEKVVFGMENGMGTFDVNQPALRGVVTYGDGFEMPFISFRSDLNSPLPIPESVVTYFRHGKDWMMTANLGRRPSFLPHEAQRVQLTMEGIQPILGSFEGQDTLKH